MAENKNIEVKEKEVKKLDDVKNTPENKEAITESVGKTKINTDKVDKKSEPAVEKVSKKGKKSEPKIELEREYIVPLKRGVLNVPHYRRAKKAIRVLKEFIVRHMGVRDRDLKKVKVDINLNNEIWFRGIKKPMNKIKIKAKKIDGIVYVELAEIPVVVGYKIAREEKKSAAAENVKVKNPKKVKEEVEADKNKDGVDDKTEEKEDAKAGAEKAAKSEKAAVKVKKHTAQGKHAQKTMPVRKVLK